MKKIPGFRRTKAQEYKNNLNTHDLTSRIGSLSKATTTMPSSRRKSTKYSPKPTTTSDAKKRKEGRKKKKKIQEEVYRMCTESNWVYRVSGL